VFKGVPQRKRRRSSSEGSVHGESSKPEHSPGARSPRAARQSLMNMQISQSTIVDDEKVCFMLPDDDPGDVFDNDYDLITLRKHVSDDFLDCFKDAVGLYLSGDWYYSY
jgi:hypothetical protein